MAEEALSKKPVGRKPMLTPTRRAEVLDKIRLGASVDAAAASVGVAGRTLRKWLQWGAGENGAEPYKSFFEECEKARGEVACAMAAVMVRVARGQPIIRGRLPADARAAARWLSVYEPQWRQSEAAIQLKSSVDRMLEIAEHVLEPSQFAILCAALAADGRPEETQAPPTTGGAGGTGDAAGPNTGAVH